MSRLSWRTKLMGLITLVLGALLLLQLFYLIPYIRNREVELTKAHQEEIARNIARELDIDLMRVQNRLTRMARQTEFRNMDIVAQQRTMVQHTEISLLISSLSVMDAKGWFVSSTVSDLSMLTTKSYAYRPYFTVPFEQGEVYFTPPRFYPSEGIVGTSVAVPIESETGERVGVLIGSMRLNELIENVANYPLEEGTVAFLVDKEGTVVAHSEIDLFVLEEDPLSLDLSDQPLVQAIMEGETGRSGEHDHEGTPYSGTYVVLESNGWGVVVEAPMYAILAKSDMLVRQLLSVNVALFAIAFAVSLTFTWQITAERKRAEKALEEMVEERSFELVRTIEQFEREITEHEQTEEVLQERTRELGERVRELNCLYSISDLVEKPGISLGEILQGTVDLIPSAWQYPEIACARIILEGQEFRTEDFRETIWKQASDVVVHGERIGTLEVCYLEERPGEDEGPFLREEITLINGIAERLEEIIELVRAEEELKKHRDHLEELVKERTAELMRAIEQLEWEITERKRAEAALTAVNRDLRESEQQIRTLLSNIPGAIYRCAFDADWTMQFVSDAVEDISGYLASDFVLNRVRTHASIIHPGDREMVEKAVHEGVDQRKPYVIEYRIIHADGKVYWVYEKGQGVFGESGEVLWLDGAIFDITERKRAEEQLQQYAAELKEANAELSQYAYVVSHDVRAPLRAIHNYADFLREDLETTLDGDQKAYLDGLNHAVREAEELVGDLLELSQVGQRSAPTETVEVGAFLRERIASLGLPAEVEIVIASDWPTIVAEPTLLRQIFQNLIDNAVKFNTSPRKRVELGWRPVGPVGDEQYELFVRDNGIGIAPRYHEQIFRVFERLHTSEEYEGTGIGLAIVKKATSRLRGSVRVESRSGEGSTFFVTLPRTQ